MNAALAEYWPRGLIVTVSPVDSPAAAMPIAEEVVTPEQFFTPVDRSRIAWTPERRLLLAVLEDAVVMFLRYRNSPTTRGKRLFRETRAWFDSTDRTSLCAFETICDHLNLDADYIRRGLQRLAEPVSSASISPKNLLRHLRHTRPRLLVVSGSDCP